jgi:hypothetical protein
VSFGEADRYAIRKVKIFAGIFLVLTVVSFIFIVVEISSGLFRANSPGFLSGVLAVTVVWTIVGGIAEVVGLIQLRSAFKALVGVDSIPFGLPSRLTLVALITVPLVYAGLVLLLIGESILLPNFPNVAGSTPSSLTSVLSSGGIVYLIVGSLLTFGGGLAALVGFIGVLLGLWRVGTRYNSAAIRAGAILMVAPLVQIAAPIVILVGARDASKKLESTGKP